MDGLFGPGLGHVKLGSGVRGVRANVNSPRQGFDKAVEHLPMEAPYMLGCRL